MATKSFKMKLVTKSSTESELVVVEESIPYVMWMFDLCENLCLRVNKPVYLTQDNMLAIGIINYGGSSSRSKYMIALYIFVKQHMELGDITFKHCTGEVMPADMLTKPLDEPDKESLVRILA